MKHRPIGTNILVQEIKQDHATTAAGLITIITSEYKMGKVLAVGTGHEFHDGTSRPLHVKVGDTIFFQPHGLTGHLQHDSVSVLVIKEHDVISVVEPEEPEE